MSTRVHLAALHSPTWPRIWSRCGRFRSWHDARFLDDGAFVLHAAARQCAYCREKTDPQARYHAVSVSIFCGALAGALHAVAVAPGLTLADLVAAYVAGDASLLEVILDAAEERGLDMPGNWPRVEVAWLPVTGRHEHEWLPWRSGDDARAERVPWGDTSEARRCTCGVFEHERDRLTG